MVRNINREKYVMLFSLWRKILKKYLLFPKVKTFDLISIISYHVRDCSEAKQLLYKQKTNFLVLLLMIWIK